MTDEALSRAATLVSRRIGLRLDPALQGRLARCVVEGAAARGVDALTYVTALSADPAAMQELLNRVTVQETSFFRDPAQFDALVDHVLPQLPDPITVWSAGCANGQEPYSLAMVLEESGRKGWRVIATDVSTRALDRTRTARYAERELRGLSPARLATHLRREGKEWHVRDELRRGVDIAPLNLVGEMPPFAKGECAVVFCRNVLIYFSPAEVSAFLRRLAERLPVGGYLFLGFSETLWQVTEEFQLVRIGEAFVYLRTDPDRVTVPSGRVSAAALSRRKLGAPLEPRRRERSAAPRPARAGRPSPTSEAAASAHSAQGDGADVDAVTEARRAAYTRPDDPVAHLELGLALEAAGEQVSARRAFAAARQVLTTTDPAKVEAMLEGYHSDELARLLDRKLEIG